MLVSSHDTGMIQLDIRFFSSSLGHFTSCILLLPDAPAPTPDQPIPPKPNWPILFLLHGYSDDHTIWHRRTSIERYVEGLGLAVAFPNGGLSFYTDLPSGAAYGKLVGEELPRFLSTNFPISSAQEDTFIAGFSMGGYGAFRTALNRPERFAAAASFSGALDAVARYEGGNCDFASAPALKSVFGEKLAIAGTDNDLFHLLARQEPGKAPKLWQHCGKNDFLHKDNQSFRQAAKGKHVDLIYTETEGEHNWGYIDQNLPSLINWLKPQIRRTAA